MRRRLPTQNLFQCGRRGNETNFSCSFEIDQRLVTSSPAFLLKAKEGMFRADEEAIGERDR